MRGFVALEQSLIRQRAQAVAAGRDVSALSAKLARTQAAMAGAAPGAGGGGLGAVGQQLASRIPGGGALAGLAGGGATAAAAAGFAALAGSIALASKALSEFAAKQVAVGDLDQVLANSGQLTDEYRSKLQDLAGQMEASTNIADDQWLAALTKLTQAGANSGNIDQLTEATKNFAAVTGGSAVSSAEAIGRAMKGQFTAFSRMGIQIDKNATQTEKMDSLFQQLAQRGGGILENRLKTLSGSYASLKTATGNVTESMGGILNRFFAVQETVESLAVAMKFWGDLLPQTVGQIEGLANKTPIATATLEQMEDATASATEESKKFADANKESTDSLNREISALDNKRRRLDAQTDSATQLKLAQIDLDEASGTKTGSQANIERAQVRAASEREKIQTELNTLTAEVVALDKNQVVETERLLEAKRKVIELEFVITQEKNTQAGLEASLALPGAQKIAGEADKAFAEAQAKRDEKRFDISSRQGVLGVQNQIAGLGLRTDLVKARATAGAEDNAQRAGRLAQAGAQLANDPGRDIFSTETTSEKLRAQLNKAGQDMGAGTTGLIQEATQIMRDQAALAVKLKAELDNARQLTANTRP